MTGNRILFTSYKAYDGGHVIFGSNLKGKVIGGGNISHNSITITNVEHVSGLAFNFISIGSFTSQSIEIVKRTRRKLRKMSRVMLDEQSILQKFWCHALDTESLNVTFDESLPEPKSSSLVEDDSINEPVVQDLNGSSSLQVNVLDEGYPKSVKEVIGHPIKQVIVELNERTLSSKTKQA
ncbi:hypothetical protein Tco_0995139 [Tanacetum coccineum]